jgi:signal transduction histidine kinase
MRFRTKTILGIAVIEITLLAILVGSTLSVLRKSNEAELIRRVQLAGQLLAVAAKDALISQDLATLDSLVDEAMISNQIDFVRILDARGVVLTERGVAPLLARPFHQETTIAQVSDNIFDWSSLVVVGNIRYGEVQLGVSTHPLADLMASTQRWAAGIAGIEMLLVAMFSWLLGSYLVRQLGVLREASYTFAAGIFNYRVPVKGNDELAQVAGAFNLMAQQLGTRENLLHEESIKYYEAQKEAEFAKFQAEDRTEQLNAIFELSPDGFVTFDAAGRVKYMNPAFTRISGLPTAEIIGLDEADFSARLARECIGTARFQGIAALREIKKLGAGESSYHPQQIELTGVGNCVLEVVLRESQASTVSQILYFRDITHETEIDRMKSEFLATAAHELRTPMSSIYGFAELLVEREFSAAEQREYLGIIFRQSQLMANIINELLDLARIEARRGQDFVITRIDPRILMQEIVTGFKTSEGRLPPELQAGEIPLQVDADRSKLIQAITNVLSNAYKYSPGGGAVAVEFIAPTIEAQSLSNERTSRVGIRITDQGIGMTPEQLACVCERFYRADASGKIPGTGLGMSIVKEIVELHGGELNITSTIGAGTTVTIWLPGSTQPPAEPT